MIDFDLSYWSKDSFAFLAEASTPMVPLSVVQNIADKIREAGDDALKHQNRTQNIIGATLHDVADAIEAGMEE